MRERPRDAVARSLLAVLLLFQSTPSIAGTPHHPGNWTNSRQWSEIAVHMLLVPSPDSGHHSRVLWYRGDEENNPGIQGGLWDWSVPGDSAVNAGVYPNADFDSVALASPSIDIFCTGMTQLADGRVLITGGNENGEVGLKNSTIYDPSTNQWVSKSRHEVATLVSHVHGPCPTGECSSPRGVSTSMSRSSAACGPPRHHGTA